MESVKSAALPGAILQIKIRLLGISPMIWRRVLVPESMSLRELHGVVQLAMGWEGIHLFEFSVFKKFCCCCARRAASGGRSGVTTRGGRAVNEWGRAVDKRSVPEGMATGRPHGRD